MSFPFIKGIRPSRANKPIDPKGCRPLGRTFDGQPLFEPNDTGSSLVFAATGGGKTTRVAVTAIQAALANPDRAVIINDVKRGEIAMQIAEMCRKYGRKFGVIDDFNVLGADYPYRLSINPISPIVEARKRNDPDLPFLVENFVHTLIPEPKGDEGGQGRNFFWTESARGYAATALRKLLDYPQLATPGGLSDLLNDPAMFSAGMKMLAEDGEGPLKGRAQQILNSQQHNPDLFAQHIISAQSSLKIFAEGPLHGAGAGADITHEEILRDNWIICIVSPTQYLDRLGPWFASHFNSFMDIQMTGTVGKTDFIIDEYCSGPFEPALKRITVQRIFGSRLILITQSRRDSIRRYGEDFTAVLEENSLVLQILKITQFEEAERISKSMGETRVVTASLGMNNRDQNLQTTFNTSKERHFSPTELMALPENEQVILIPGVGWIHCLKLGQHEIGPYAYDLEANRYEGGVLTPDIKVTLTTPKGGLK